ncbi:hypothetical protein L0222_22895 [bacterium]|nr:hypothetical protein [bacterium]
MVRAFLLFLLLLSACREAPEGVLITLPGAKDVKTHHLRGMDVLEYELNARYPAKELIAQIGSRLKNQGWKPVPYIYLFPKNESSQVRGWTFFNDPPREPVWVIYEWTGDWLDRQGNLLTYTFRYKDPAAKYQQSTFILKPVDNRMFITAIYTPAGIARHKQRMLNPQK